LIAILFASDRGLVITPRTLVLDQAGAEAVTALRAAGIEPVLLKGASIASWLYPDVPRAYGDVDLLIDPDRGEDAAAVLRTLGFDPVPYEVSPHAHPWVRVSDGAQIDLHWALFGPKASPQRCWNELRGWTEPTDLASVPVLTLNPAARVLQVVLHASQHVDAQKPLEDLRRALRLVPEPVWRDAERLADRIGALHRMENGLGLVEGGSDIVEQLPLVRAARMADREHAPLAVALARLSQARGAAAKLRALRVALELPEQPELSAASRARRLRARTSARARQLALVPVRLPRTLWVTRRRLRA
jgi:hypothetical protein